MGAEQVYLSVPSQSLRENLRIVRELIPADAHRDLPDEGCRAAAPELA